MTALEIGTLEIDNPQVESYIETKSMDELKSMILNYMETQANNTTDFQATKQKGKWGKFADRMSGLTNSKITKHLEKTSQDFRDSFELRNISTH